VVGKQQAKRFCVPWFLQFTRPAFVADKLSSNPAAKPQQPEEALKDTVAAASLDGSPEPVRTKLEKFDRRHFAKLTGSGTPVHRVEREPLFRGAVTREHRFSRSISPYDERLEST
jgi:hypothetical protein